MSVLTFKTGLKGCILTQSDGLKWGLDCNKHEIFVIVTCRITRVEQDTALAEMSIPNSEKYVQKSNEILLILK
jgi:hypothetical protein